MNFFRVFPGLYLGLLLLTAPAGEPAPVQTTPTLEGLEGQIKANPQDSQAYSNRGYVLALLGRKDESRADLKRAVELKDGAPMRNRVGWAYFNIGDYAEAVKQFEKSAELSNFHGHYDYYSLVL